MCFCHIFVQFKDDLYMHSHQLQVCLSMTIKPWVPPSPSSLYSPCSPPQACLVAAVP